MNFKDLRSAVQTASLSYEEIKQLWDILKVKHETNIRFAAMAFRPGQRVKFTNTKTHTVITGTVIKNTAKMVHLRTDAGMLWRVGPGLLSTAQGETA